MSGACFSFSFQFFKERSYVTLPFMATAAEFQGMLMAPFTSPLRRLEWAAEEQQHASGLSPPSPHASPLLLNSFPSCCISYSYSITPEKTDVGSVYIN